MDHGGLTRLQGLGILLNLLPGTLIDLETKEERGRGKRTIIEYIFIDYYLV